MPTLHHKQNKVLKFLKMDVSNKWKMANVSPVIAKEDIANVLKCIKASLKRNFNACA